MSESNTQTYYFSREKGNGVTISKKIKSGFSPMRFLKSFSVGIRVAFKYLTNRKSSSSKKPSSGCVRPIDSIEAHSREAIDDCIDYIKACSPSPISKPCDSKCST